MMKKYVFLVLMFFSCSPKQEECPTDLNFEPYTRPFYVPIGRYAEKEFSAKQIPITVLYRLNSGEVRKISQKGQTFEDANSLFWGVLVNPSFPDGMQERPFRQLGIAKIAVDSLNLVRNATATEISNFGIIETDDRNQEHADGTVRRLDQDKEFRIFARALVRLLVKEFNRSRQADGATTITVQQAWNALKNEIDKNEAAN